MILGPTGCHEALIGCSVPTFREKPIGFIWKGQAFGFDR